MNDHPTSLPNGRPRDDDDLQIRRLLTDCSLRAVPAGIEQRVLKKVKRRRNAVRAAGAAAIMASIVTVGLFSRSPLATQPGRGAVAHADASLSSILDVNGDIPFEENDILLVAASPPVASLALVDQNQLGLLECLKSLTEE